jgi:hypothetical protein|nr:hypothetical protein [uncultured Campylobacter sp.]
MKNILVWGYPVKDNEKREKLKIPFCDQIGILEKFNIKKTHPPFSYKWVDTGINDNIHPMPKDVTICIKSIKNISFDFLPYGLGFYIVSEKLLSFLEKNGFDYNFDKSISYLVNTKGNLLTDEAFYLVRIIGWKIKEEVVYPDLANPKHGLSAAAYTDSHRDILLTRNYCYLNTLIVNKDLKDEILTLFRNPFLYSLDEWKKLS